MLSLWVVFDSHCFYRELHYTSFRLLSMLVWYLLQIRKTLPLRSILKALFRAAWLSYFSTRNTDIFHSRLPSPSFSSPALTLRLATMGSLGASFDVVGAKPEYQIIEKPSRSGRKIRIICLGAGASALNLAHEVSISPLDLDLVCYDKNPSIGGTWYENRYPGCGCDIPSVNYQFSWAPSSEWSS